MAPRRRDAGPKTPATPSQDNTFLKTPTSAAPPRTPGQSAATPITPSFARSASTQKVYDILDDGWRKYLKATPKRIKILDVFMVFLVVVGGLQFAYCVLAGNYPFNAFLAGFSAAVGQFVLTASLRMQTNPENTKEFKGTSDERAFADFIFGSLVLHFFCVNFIN